MSSSSSYYGNQNQGSDDTYFVGSSSDAYDIRYQDDSHSTYGLQWSSTDDNDEK